MTPTMSQVHGWSPVKAEDDFVRDLDFIRQTNKLILPAITAAIAARGPSPPSTPPALVHTSGKEVQEEKRTQKGDPAWIARPRNPFIIFRCDYSKIHCNTTGKRIRYPPGTRPDKPTLSKRAGDAWRKLPSEERKFYEELAEKEKNDHIKRYPNYRFKPAKRRSSKKTTSSVKSAKSYEKLNASPPSRPHTPIEFNCSSPGLTYPLSSNTPDLSPVPLPAPIPPPAPEIAEVKAGRRRSSSMPSLPLDQQPIFLTGPRLNMKRSRSVMGQSSIRSPLVEEDESTGNDVYHGATHYNQPLFAHPNPEEPYVPYAPQLYREPSNVSTFSGPTDYVAPTLTMASSSSSLANWNGESPALEQHTSQGSPDFTSPSGFESYHPHYAYPSPGAQDPIDCIANSLYSTSLGSWSSSELWSLDTNTSPQHLDTPLESPTDMFPPPFVSSMGEAYAAEFPDASSLAQHFDYHFENQDTFYPVQPGY